MKKLLVLVLCILLTSSCAPLMLLRTPRPVEAGQIKGEVGFGYGMQLTQVVSCSGEPGQPGGETCYTEGGFIGTPFEPLAMPVQIGIAQGVGNDGELDWTIQLGFLPGFRLGYKRLLVDGPVLVAMDGGGSLNFVNWGLDLGVMASMPLEEWEPYMAVRGFYTRSWTIGQLQGIVTGAITLGTRVNTGVNLYLELTLASQVLNEVRVSSDNRNRGIPSVGWVLVPAFGIRF